MSATATPTRRKAEHPPTVPATPVTVPAPVEAKVEQPAPAVEQPKPEPTEEQKTEMRAAKALEAQSDLKRLADQISGQNVHIGKILSQAVDHAVMCGKYLDQARETFDEYTADELGTTWDDWVTALDMTVQTAGRYRRISRREADWKAAKFVPQSIEKAAE
ncbi:hypothetical protein [Fimbriiglobus ruber]|nr:hypothetical protein [Fimbriiglobus ruber]